MCDFDFWFSSDPIHESTLHVSNNKPLLDFNFGDWTEIQMNPIFFCEWQRTLLFFPKNLKLLDSQRLHKELKCFYNLMIIPNAALQSAWARSLCSSVHCDKYIHTNKMKKQKVLMSGHRFFFGFKILEHRGLITWLTIGLFQNL